MPLTDAERQKLAALIGTAAPSDEIDFQPSTATATDAIDFQPTDSAAPTASAQPAWWDQRQQATEQAISERPSFMPYAAAANAAKFLPNPGKIAQQMLMPGVSAMQAAPEAGLQLAALDQTGEAALAAPALALQRGQPSQALPDTIKALVGQRPAEFGDVYRNAGAPGPVAAGLGLMTAGIGAEELTGVLSSGAQGLRQAMRPKMTTVAEVLQVPEAKLPKLTQLERRAYFEARSQRIKQQTAQTAQQLKEEKVFLQKELGKAATQRSLELRPQIPAYLSRQSSHYRTLADAELAPVANNAVETTKLAAYVKQRWGKDPEALAEVSSRLGLTNDALEKTTVSPLLDELGRPIQETVPTTLKIGELYQRAKDMGQAIPSTVRESLRVYTRDEHFIDDSIDTLTGFLRENGVNLRAANEFWSGWSRVRNQLVRETRPYNLAGTQTASFSRRLIKLAQGMDPDNVLYADTVAKGLGIDNLPGNLKQVVGKLDANQKAQFAVKLDQAEQLGQLRDLRLQVGQIVDQNAKKLHVVKWISNLLFGLTGLGATSAMVAGALKQTGK